MKQMPTLHAMRQQHIFKVLRLPLPTRLGNFTNEKLDFTWEKNSFEIKQATDRIDKIDHILRSGSADERAGLMHDFHSNVID